MALINLRNALMAGKRLPYDAEVEYLESTGTQWIEIGMTFDTRCVLDMTFQFTQFKPHATCHGQTLGDAQKYPARFAFGKGAASWNDWYCGIGDKNYRTGKALDLAVHRFVVDAPGDKFVIDDTTYNVGRTSFALPSNPNSAMLYNRARIDSSVLDESGVYGKLHCCQIHQDGVLVRDFVPVRVGTVGYLYDRVSGNLFGNAGTGDFVLGLDKAASNRGGGYKRKCVKRSYRRSLRPSYPPLVGGRNPWGRDQAEQSEGRARFRLPSVALAKDGWRTPLWKEVA